MRNPRVGSTPRANTTVREGLERRRADPGPGRSPDAREQPAGIAGAVVAWLLPLVLAILEAAPRDTVVTVGGPAALGLLAALRVVTRWRERRLLASVLLHPVTAIATLGPMLLRLIDAFRGRPATWRGQPYEEPKP